MCAHLSISIFESEIFAIRLPLLGKKVFGARKIRQGIFESGFLPLAPGPFSINHGCELRRSPVNIVVENHVLKKLELLNLSGRSAQASIQIRS